MSPASTEESPQPKKNRPDTGWLGVYIGLGGSGVLYLIQANGVSPNWWGSALGYLISGGVIIWGLWKYAFGPNATTSRAVAFLLSSAFLLFAGSIGVYRQFLRDQEDALLQTTASGTPNFEKLMSIPPIELSRVRRLRALPPPVPDRYTIRTNTLSILEKSLRCLKGVKFMDKSKLPDAKAYQRLLLEAKKLAEAEHTMYVGARVNGKLEPIADNELYAYEAARASAIRSLRSEYAVIKPQIDGLRWAYDAVKYVVDRSAEGQENLGDNHALLASFRQQIGDAILVYRTLSNAVEYDPEVNFSSERHSPETTSLAYNLAQSEPLLDDLISALESIVQSLDEDLAKEAKNRPVNVASESANPRILTKEQKKVLIDELRVASSNIVAIRFQQDDECRNYSAEFADVFRNSGWNLREPQPMLNFFSNQGIAILVPHGREPEGAIILWRSLIAAKIPTLVYCHPELPPDRFELAIGYQEGP